MMLFRLMDTEMVINEVRTRECLWNPRNVYYKHKMEKSKAWGEVSEAVVPKYKTCSVEDKKRIVKAVQSRWKTARDAYMKSRITEVKKPRYKSRQHTYIYKDHLTFLEQLKDYDRYEDEEVSNSFVENTVSQSSNGASDEDAGNAREEVMEFTIDIHDDFKDKIKDLITDETVIKEVNDNVIIEHNECLPGISSQNDDQGDPLAKEDTIDKSRKRSHDMGPGNVKSKMSEFEVNLSKVMGLNNSTKPFALEADDLFFFDSLAPFIINFDIHQKLKFRSKILELVMEVGNIRPVTVKQENGEIL